MADMRKEDKDMGHCSFQRSSLEIVIRDGEGRQRYELDLERCGDAAGLLDGILQVADKTWCTPSMLKSLLDEINRACRETFGRGVQGTYCPFGQNKQVDWRKKVMS